MDLTHALATNAVEVKDCVKYVKLKSNQNVLFTTEVTEMASYKWFLTLICNDLSSSTGTPLSNFFSYHWRAAKHELDMFIIS